MKNGQNGYSLRLLIIDSNLLLFLSSVNSNVSDNVKKEVGVANKHSKAIIPILLDNSNYARPIKYDLNYIDHIKYTTGVDLKRHL